MILKSKDSNRPIDPIALLRARLKSIETALLFDGKAYPDALIPMPFELIGRGFFPGADGLWRGQSALREPSTHPYPFDGIMFVGQDFGSVVLQAQHPSSDYGVINRIPPSKYHDRCNDLAQAWAIAKKALEPEIIS